METRNLVILSGLVIALSMIGFYASILGGNEPGNVTVISLGQSGIGSFMISYGRENGIFDKYDLNVTFIGTGDTYTATLGFITGKADILLQSAGLAAKAYDDGERFRIGMVFRKANDFLLLAQPGIEQVEDLKGKNIGFMGRSSDSYQLTKWYFESKGMDIEEDTNVVEIMNPSGIVTALDTGQLDAAILWGERSIRVMESSGVSSLISATEMSKEVIGHDYYLVVVMVSEDLVANKQRDLDTFLRAMREIAQDVNKNKEEAAEIWAQLADQPVEETMQVLESYEIIGDLTPEIQEALLAFWNYGAQKGYFEKGPGEEVFYTEWR